MLKKIIQPLWRATRYSWQGLQHAIRERAFCWELIIFIVLTPVAIMVSQHPWQFALLMMSLLLILIVELINSAIETVINRISLDHHPLSAKAKDLGSAAVMLTIVNAIICWSVILIQSLC
ncbi:MAG: diacylglycerol kinase [Legionellales bacterium]|nr:diacylglycerol kinase [Legionellales bacterium]